MVSPDYWQRVRDEAARLGSDGCTMGSAAFRDCCLEHDVHYRTGYTIDGQPLHQHEADLRLRACIQRNSRFGWYSPLAWGRYVVLKWRGQKAWKANANIRAEEQRRREALAKETETA